MAAFAAFVDATDLKQWAERRIAQQTLPEIVRRLVHATAPSAARISFRAGEGVQLGGWDGLVSARAATPFVPAGDSGWELGVDKGVRGKADGDFEARRTGDGVIEPASSTFLFVTPRRFRDKVTWATDAKRGSDWNDVRAYDADDLAAWLEQAPAVHAWVSAELGKLQPGVRSLDDAWSAWQRGTVPPFPAGLALAGRDAQAAEVTAWLTGEPSAYAIRADSADEALGFLASVVQQLADEHRTDVLARTLVVDDTEALRQLRRFAAPLILVPTFVPNDPGASDLHTLIVSADRSTPSGRGALTLPPIRREPAEKLLLDMGLNEDAAREFATLARRSLPALRRRLASSPVTRAPSWAMPGPARALLPVILAGRWREDHDGDRAVLERLAGKSYRDFAADIAPWFDADEPPLRRNGSVILATAPDQTWELLARYLTPDDLRTFSEIAKAVLEEVDPRLSMARDERWLAGARGIARVHSDHLREGIAESLLRFATEPTPVAGQAGAGIASWVAHELLEAATSGATGAPWISLSDVLPTLAEAAPDVFLRAVDRALAGPSPLLTSLFPPDGDGGFGSAASEHAATIWALETLAWSPAYLGRAGIALATLARLDTGGNTSPRPAESLATILHPVLPQTSADVATRLEVLRAVLRAEPDVGFALLLELIPKRGILLPTHAPRRQPWRSGPNAQASFSEVSAFVDAVIAELLTRAGTDLGRWAAIVDLLFDLPDTVASRVLGPLAQVPTSSAPDDSGRVDLLQALRRYAAHRRSGPATDESQADAVDALIRRFESTDPAVANAWLFAHSPNLPLPRGEDWREFEADLQRMREEAAREVLDARAFTAVRNLALRSESPWHVGYAVAAAEPSDDLAAQMVALLLDSEPLRALAAGWVAKRFAERGWDWVRDLEHIGAWTPTQCARLLLALPPGADVWDFAARLGKEVEQVYWRETLLRVVPKGRHVVRAATELLEAGRPHLALDLLALHRDELEPGDRELLYRTLEEAATTPLDATKDPPIQSYDVDRLLDVIENDDDADIERVARIEWTYLPLMRHEERPAKLLQAELARSPQFFATVLSWVFKGDSEPPRDPTDEERARGRSAFQLLNSWRQPPGVDTSGNFDPEALRTWVLAARSLVHAADRADIGDQRIGHILRYTPKGDDGRWPAEPVRDLLEELGAEHVEIGIAVELRNSRGVTRRGLTEGGKQERELEAGFREDAAAFMARWPRTAALMLSLADSYARDARREDADADLTEDTWR